MKKMRARLLIKGIGPSEGGILFPLAVSAVGDRKPCPGYGKSLKWRSVICPGKGGRRGYSFGVLWGKNMGRNLRNTGYRGVNGKGSREVKKRLCDEGRADDYSGESDREVSNIS